MKAENRQIPQKLAARVKFLWSKESVTNFDRKSI